MLYNVLVILFSIILLLHKLQAVKDLGLNEPSYKLYTMAIYSPPPFFFKLKLAVYVISTAYWSSEHYSELSFLCLPAVDSKTTITPLYSAVTVTSVVEQSSDE